jgi:hypothetical protein
VERGRNDTDSLKQENVASDPSQNHLGHSKSHSHGLPSKIINLQIWGFVPARRLQRESQEYHFVYVALPLKFVMCLIMFQLETKYFAEL